MEEATAVNASAASDQLTLARDRTFLAYERTLMAWTRDDRLTHDD